MRLSPHLPANRVHFKNGLLLLLVCLLTWWPLTFGVFSVKNDAIHYFLPYRFNISEAIRNGELPFWSPYIYNGAPLLGDMQSGAWNPVVWLFSLVGRYDLTLFHLENLLYIFLGGLGMYKLSLAWVKQPGTALLIGMTYMLSGFMLGGQLINWLAAAAFIPFVLHYALQTLRTGSYRAAVKGGIALYLLFVAGYPSFFILTGYLLVLIWLERLVRINKMVKPPQLLLTGLLFASVFILLSLPAIIAYADLLPQYSRGSGTSLADAATNAFHPVHLLSLLYPGTIRANDITTPTDITCRNIYLGLLPLLVLLIHPPRMSRRTILLLALALFSLAFSMGNLTPVQGWCYKLVPLLDTFRHPSQMRLFFILSVLSLMAPSLDVVLSGQTTQFRLARFKNASALLALLLLIGTVYGFFQSGLLSNGLTNSGAGISQLKLILERVTLADTLVLTGGIQLLFITILWWKTSWFLQHTARIGIWSVLNLVVMAQLVLPASFVSSQSPRTINSIIHASPRGFPAAPANNTLAGNSTANEADFNLVSLASFYNKQPGISKIANNPAFLAQADSFLHQEVVYNYVANHALSYLAFATIPISDSALLKQDSCGIAVRTRTANTRTCDSAGQSEVVFLSANKISIQTNATQNAWLILTQNYHHWWTASIDGKPATIEKMNTAFMGIAVSPGKHMVTWQFNPAPVKRLIWLSAIAGLLLFCGLLFVPVPSKSVNS